MDKINIANLLSAVFLAFSFCAPACVAGPAESREFFSPNKAYVLKVTNGGRNDFPKYSFELKNSAGKTISSFTNAYSPVSVSVSNDGKRLAAQCGFWGRNVIINELVFFDAAGIIIKAHPLELTGVGGDAFSQDCSTYAYGYINGENSGITLFDLATGEKLWDHAFKAQLSGFKLAGGEKRLLALTSAGKNHSIYLIDASGGELWRAELTTTNRCAPEKINMDGSRFEVLESKDVYNEKTGYVHSMPVKRHHYIFEKNTVREKAVEDMKVELPSSINPHQAVKKQ